MRKFVGPRARRIWAAVAVAALALAVMAQNALAAYVPQDYSPAEEGVVAELKAALEKFWVPLAIMIAVPLGIKLFRRLVK